ncbi:MAG: hypothetical protein OEV91_11575 [Desulfobulbaceae bacterium]|nr:hypothetical protein [Desulfobulbaceae bacterium]
MILSIDESIQRLKAEILSQDWRLSPRRLELLEAAFTCLKNRFKSRKGMLAILAMADGAVDYMRKREEERVPPETIDFLKETMAHIVTLYEDHDYDPEREDELFKRVFGRFNFLKQKVQTGRVENGDDARQAVPAAVPAGQRPVAASQSGADPVVGRLLDELRPLLGRRDGSSLLLQRLLAGVVDAARAGEQLTAARLRGLVETLERKAVPAVAVQAAPPAAPKVLRRHEVLDCPATPVRILAVGDVRVVVPESAVSLVRPLKPRKRGAYLRNGRVPLADLSRLLKGLASQFRGPLATMKDRQLKQLSLPVMAPHGISLPEIPDEDAAWMVGVSHGNWHGVVFCAEAGEAAVTMVKFRKGKNGDIAGTAYLEDGGAAPLLDVERLLRREGFLTTA